MRPLFEPRPLMGAWGFFGIWTLSHRRRHCPVAVFVLLLSAAGARHVISPALSFPEARLRNSGYFIKFDKIRAFFRIREIAKHLPRA